MAITLGGLLIFRRTVLGEKRSVWAKEIIFWLGLVVFALSGLLLSFSLGQLVDDPGSLGLLSWLSPLPYLSAIIAIIALVILAAEAFWFWRWINYLMDQRKQIINDLRAQHRKDVDEVSQFISDTGALQILRRTGLTVGNGGPGSYYDRIDQLYKRLVEISHQAKIQTDLAANRLALSLSDIQPGAPKTGGPWLNLDIREEWLDVESLTAGFQRLGDRLTKEVEELKEFSELLLRMMGEEHPFRLSNNFEKDRSRGTESNARCRY